MCLFRSEEHVDRWIADGPRKPGDVLPVRTVWELAKAWYSSDPRRADWKPRTRDENQRVLASVGLTGEFWELP